jgi:RND family efflux transporter MFP subunit
MAHFDLFKRRQNDPGMATTVRRLPGKPLVFALAALVAIGGAVAWRAIAAKKPDKKDEAKVFEFAPGDMAVLQPVRLGQVIPVSGSLKPLLQATVKAKVAAEVSRVLVQEGERVQSGQVLVALDTADLKARLDSQLASVAEAKARMDLARKTRESNQQLLAKGFISQNAFDSLQNSVEVAEANFRSAEAQATIARRALEDAQVRAPFSGIVAKRFVNTGDKVSPDAPVAQVVDLARMELETQVPVGEIPFVKVGHEISFKVDGFAERAFKGKVERINPSADAGSRSIAVFVTLPNADGSLRGGMFANGTLAVADKAPVNTLPLAAVAEEGGQSHVFTIRDGKLDRRPVKTGTRNVEQGLIEVREGLNPGERVVAIKAAGMKAGAEASVRPDAPTRPARSESNSQPAG